MASLIVVIIIPFSFAGLMLFLRWKIDRDNRKAQEEWDVAHPRAQELLDKVRNAYQAYRSFEVEHKDYNEERIDELRNLKKYTPSECHAEYDREILTLQADYYRSIIELDELRQKWQRAINEYRNYIE